MDLTIRDLIDYISDNGYWETTPGSRLVLEFRDYKYEWVADIVVYRKRIHLNPRELKSQTLSFTLEDLYKIILKENLIEEQKLMVGNCSISQFFLSKDLYLMVD